MPTNLQYDWNLEHVKSSSMVFSVCSYWRLVVLCLRNAGLNTTVVSDNSIQAVRPRALMFLTEHETTTDLIPNIFSIFKKMFFVYMDRGPRRFARESTVHPQVVVVDKRRKPIYKS